MQVNRVIGHRKIAHADSHAITFAHHQRVDAWKHPAIEGPQVEVEHGVDLRGHAARVDIVGIDEEHEVAVDAILLRIPRVDHEEALHPHRHLHHLVGVRVIHEGSAVLHHELVGEGLTGFDMRLSQAAHTIHAVRRPDAVPVNRGVLRQLVGNEDAYPVAFDAFDGRPGALAVVAPEVRLHAGRELPDHRFCNQMKLLDAVLHPPGE